MLSTYFIVILKPAPITLTTRIIAWIIALTISSLFALTQYRVLELETPQQRKIKPALVWLTAIPYIGSVFQFYFTKHLAASIGRQLHENNRQQIKQPTLAIGLLYCVLSFIACVIGIIKYFSSSNYSTLNGWSFIFWLICFIIYWVRLGVFKRRIQQAQTQIAQA